MTDKTTASSGAATESGSSYVSAINTVKVPVWVVRVVGGFLLLLGAGAGATIFCCLIWIAILTTAVGNQNREQKALRGSLVEAQKQSSENQKRLDKTLRELEDIQTALKALKPKGE